MVRRISPCILFRYDRDSEEEYRIASQYFDVFKYRTECKNKYVIGRYSVLPYYTELETDLNNQNSYLINTYSQHRWIANFEWYSKLKEFTPETWTDNDICECDHDGPLIIKGKTNSRKHEWNKMMFAPTRRDALILAGELMKDPLIGPQGIVYRKYIPLRTFEVGMNGLPFTNEWRLFYLGETLLSGGYYWSSAERSIEINSGGIPAPAIELGNIIAKICSQHTNLFVLDIAETEAGKWILIEVNDGQMSGLSENDPHTLYSSLLKKLA